MERIDRLRAAISAFLADGELDPEFFAPDFELHQASSIVDTAGVFRGATALTDPLAELRESFEDLSFEPQEFLAAPGGEIVVVVRVRGRGRGSGMALENQVAWVFTFRGDQATRLVVFEEPADALAAVGVSTDS